MTRGSRQDNSGERRRKKVKPLEEWIRALAEIDRRVREELGRSETDGVPSRDLVLEVARLADPWAVNGLDVVVPGNRKDLARRWIAARIEGRGQSEEDWLALAKEIAPAPDEHLLMVFPHKDGRLKYRVLDPRQDSITAAAEAFFKRQRDHGALEG